ncbi:MAG: hypothetical protein ACE5JG_03040, partial [Planctomycetota bacterium]
MVPPGGRAEITLRFELCGHEAGHVQLEFRYEDGLWRFGSGVTMRTIPATPRHIAAALSSLRRAKRKRGARVLKELLFPTLSREEVRKRFPKGAKEEIGEEFPVDSELAGLLLRAIESPFPDVRRDLAMWVAGKTGRRYASLQLVLARSANEELAYAGMAALLRGHEDVSRARPEVIDLFAEALEEEDPRRHRDVVFLMGSWVTGAERVRFLARVLQATTSPRAHRRVAAILERD